ncbi:MAG TPA: hypothetical protein EYQ51_01620 [Alphaproteobacteria bacterium]|nr:hypothetical protein [Alphaproteobacteria bacterium]
MKKSPLNMLGIKHKSPLNDSYTDPPATHVAMAPYYANMANTIAAAMAARGSRTDEEKDQAREDKLKRREDRKKRKIDRLEGKKDNVGENRKERIIGRIKDAKTKGAAAKTEWEKSREREYDTKGNHCPYGVDAKGDCKPKPKTESKTTSGSDDVKTTESKTISGPAFDRLWKIEECQKAGGTFAECIKKFPS